MWRVHYLESERGWSQERFHVDFDTEEEAMAAYAESQAEDGGPVPDYYIISTGIEEI